MIVFMSLYNQTTLLNATISANPSMLSQNPLLDRVTYETYAKGTQSITNGDEMPEKNTKNDPINRWYDSNLKASSYLVFDLVK